MEICLQCCSRQLLELHLGLFLGPIPSEAQDRQLDERKEVLWCCGLRQLSLQVYPVKEYCNIPFVHTPHIQIQVNRTLQAVGEVYCQLISHMLHLVENKIKIYQILDSLYSFPIFPIFPAGLKTAKTCAKCSFNQLLNCLFVQICHAHTHRQTHSLHYTQMHTVPVNSRGVCEGVIHCLLSAKYWVGGASLP